MNSRVSNSEDTIPYEPQIVGWLRSVPTLETPVLWPEAVIVLAPALARVKDFYRPSDIQSRLADERMQLWVFEIGGRVRTAAVTEVLQFPRARALNMFLVAGDGFGLWKNWIEQFKVAARGMDCRFLMSPSARFGWERVLKGTGMKAVGTMYRMEVTDG